MKKRSSDRMKKQKRKRVFLRNGLQRNCRTTVSLLLTASQIRDSDLSSITYIN
jgi:hypothetical protein